MSRKNHENASRYISPLTHALKTATTALTTGALLSLLVAGPAQAAPGVCRGGTDDGNACETTNSAASACVVGGGLCVLPIPDATCPDNLNSCTANDVVTTVVAAELLDPDDQCTGPTDTIGLRFTLEFMTTANQRYDLGVFVAGDGGTVQEPSSALACLGAASMVGDGDPNSNADADADLFQNLDGPQHGDLDVCGDLSTAEGPVQWTVEATVACTLDVGDDLLVPSCRVWEQNANHSGNCTDLSSAGTGSKCDCTDLDFGDVLDACAIVSCDDGNPCTDDSCAEDPATGAAVCSNTPNDANACSDDDACTQADSCVAGECVGSDPIVCSSGDECNSPGTCDPLDGICKGDEPLPAGTACGDPSDTVCDDPDTCDGSGSCQDNNEPTTTVCRADTGQCDVAETCDGAGACPADGFEPSTTTCTGASNGDDCDATDYCSGTADTCVDGFEPSTTVCRADTGQCDVEETCTGDSGACPADGFEPSTTTCTGASNGDDCDATDYCSGTADTCVDGFEPSTTVCRADTGQCDVEETCTGDSGACPADGFEPSTTTCTGASNGDDCDATDHCSGTADTCVDGFEPSTTVCRADTGQCDVEETCTGDSGACPADGFEPSTTTCTGASNGDDCDATDYCSGTADTCVDGFEPSTTVCRADTGQCDVEETCTGDSGACPADGFEPSTRVCRADTGQCDVEETCTGDSGACPADGFEPLGTACGDPSDGVCDDPDTCDGSGSCQDNNEPSTTVCREDAGECDVEERCDGTGSCPADAYEPAGTTCGDSSAEVCDHPDTCDGAGGCQPNYESQATICRADVGDCDVAETCNGEGECPTDGFEPDGTACDDGEVCTGPDACVAGVCESSPIQPTLTVIKQVINEIRGTLEADDFRLLLDDGTTQTEFRVAADPADPTIGSAMFDMGHGVSYQVSEILGDLADYYEVAYDGGCSGTASCLDPDATCVVTNDDIYRNQASIALRSLTVELVDEDSTRMQLAGEFSITDESESGDEPDGFIILLDDYELDWQHRDGDDTEWEPSDSNGQHGGTLEIDGITVAYLCEYEIVSVDGGEPILESHQSGDPVTFDEDITIAYACVFDTSLPVDGVVRGIASTGIFAKSGHEFLTRSTFALDGSGSVAEQDEPKTCDDPNSDGKTSASDALYILQFAVGMKGHDGLPPRCPHEFCDQNCDSAVSATDSLVALKRGLGLLKKAGSRCCE